MEKTKNTSVYLEEVHIRYLALMSVISGLNKSEYLRSILDDDMAENAEVVKEFQNPCFKKKLQTIRVQFVNIYKKKIKIRSSKNGGILKLRVLPKINSKVS